MRIGLAHDSPALFWQRTASLRFQPTKRPQISAQKSKPKPSAQKAVVTKADAAGQNSAPSNATAPAAKPITKVTLADWTADGDDDVNDFFGGEKRQRGGRKKRKKTREESTNIVQNWDDIYDPSRPNSYEEYKNSDEKISELREWKDKLYAHRMLRRRSSDTNGSDKGRSNPQKSRSSVLKNGLCSESIADHFAPPQGLSFAPPHFDDHDVPIPQPADIPDDPTGEDAYARRMRLSQTGNQTADTVQVPGRLQGLSWPSPLPPPPPPPPSFQQQRVSQVHKSPSPPITANAPPSTISRAPVRYNLPSAPSELPKSEEELVDALRADEPEVEAESGSTPRSLRPGQKKFAERLMSKYGWTKGSGLGASGAGIINPLRVQVEKQKKKPDSEGGGFVGPGGRGKIIGGKKQGGSETMGKFGAMSEVVVLHGMVDGMDLDAELEGHTDGGIMQEIGEECGEKYGRVERVFIDRNNPSKAPVFIKFTSQLSALRVCWVLKRHHSCRANV